MGICVDKIGHSCGSRQGLQVFEDPENEGEHNGYCFSCHTYVPDPYGDGLNKKPDPKAKVVNKFPSALAEIRPLKPRDLPDRHLREDVLKLYKVRVGVSEQDGVTPKEVYFPYFKDGSQVPVRLKVRVLDPKKMWSYSSGEKDINLFGWEEAIKVGSKKLFITEGEFDAMALYTILKRFNKEGFDVPIPVSLPNGAASAKRDITRLAKKIRKNFKEIILVFDSDEAGQKAQQEVLSVLPEAKVVTFAQKDANAALIEAPKPAFNAAMFNSGKAKNTRLVAAEDLHEAAKEVAEYGVSWPWDKVTEQTRGIRLGETIYIGAGAKMGKSEVVNTLGAHLIKEHGWKILMAKPEEANKKTYKLVAGKLVSRIFHDPKVEFDHDAYDRAGEIIRGKMLLLNLYQHMGWDTLEGDIRAAAADGCKAIFVDPITNLTNGMKAADANVELQKISQEMAALALDLQIVIFIFCHLRNPEGGPEHSYGGKVLPSQFAGSRAMERSCNYMFGVEGDRSPDLDEDQKNVRHLVLLSDREFGETGTTDLFWDRHTQQFNEM